MCACYPTDIFEDLVSPTVAATHFLSRACTKRKGTLDPVMEMCVKILNLPAEQRDPSKKDGALHVIGQVAETLTKVGREGGREGEEWKGGRGREGEEGGREGEG